MKQNKINGYAGKILRVDLTHGHITEEILDETTLKKWVGGAGFGAKYLYEEVPPGVEWDDPLHYHMILNTGRTGVDEAARVFASAAERLLVEQETTADL